MIEKRELEHSDIMEYASSISISRFPHLIVEIVKIAYKRNVFMRGGASKMIARIEREEGYE